MSEMHDFIRIVYDDDYGDPYIHHIIAENKDYVYFWTTMYGLFEVYRLVREKRKLETLSRQGNWIPFSEDSTLSQIILFQAGGIESGEII
jgi:hypothetical protein